VMAAIHFLPMEDRNMEEISLGMAWKAVKGAS